MADKNDLKKMMDAAASSKDDSQAQKNIKNKVAPRKKRWPWIVGVCLVAILGIGIYVAVPKLGNTQHLDKTSLATKTNTDDSNTTSASDSISSPVSLESWQEKSYNSQLKSNKTKFIKTVDTWTNHNSKFSSSANSGLVSTGDGFTDDTTKAEIDGKINPKFSFLTAENVNFVYSTYMNRLLNPIFGNWNLAQYSQNSPKSSQSLVVLKDMFTDNWWSNNIQDNNDYSKLPLYADWSSNDYNHTKFSKDKLARWYGEITSEHIKMNVNDDGTFKSYDITDGVKYSAYLADGKIATKTGTITLTLIQNPDTSNNPVNRLLIDSASLNMN